MKKNTCVNITQKTLSFCAENLLSWTVFSQQQRHEYIESYSHEFFIAFWNENKVAKRDIGPLIEIANGRIT